MRRVFLCIGLLTAILPCAALTGQGFSPAEAEGRFSTLEGVSAKIFAAEPIVRQAIFAKCDHRGRLWTIQYLQYPNPAGLQRVKVDRWSRTVYDRIPEPPPHGPRGADRITILEDVDGDGRADTSKDFIDGLNLVTGVEFGHGGVYVLQVPYLLFYPDEDRDDVPDRAPDVLLSGFGMEDAQALANHLTWGPDGWLYGVNGSTTTCVIRGIEFQQGCWRYHPLTKEFELFSEGGLNCFGLSFNAEGQLFYSTNGGPFVHAVQGGYFYKSFGKHGPLHNLFAYHYFLQQECDQVPGGPPTGGTICFGSGFPSPLRGAFVAGNFLGHTVSWWNLEPNGSTVRAKYGGVLWDAHDTWSGPTDFCLGPHHTAYVSDFYDQRTAHPDPDANWDRSNGRIYRFQFGPPPSHAAKNFDLATLTSDELVDWMMQDETWFADRARIELANRRDPAILARLRKTAMESPMPLQALRGLWGVVATASLDDELARVLLDHADPHVRSWTIRLLGDKRHIPDAVWDTLHPLAGEESDPIVLSQLAATAKRLPAHQMLAIVNGILQREAAVNDPRVPWLVWWALEAHAIDARDALVTLCSTPSAWSTPMIRENALRLLRRWGADGTSEGYSACHNLLTNVPAEYSQLALEAVRLGLSERSSGLEEITQGGLYDMHAEQPSSAPARRHRDFQPMSGVLLSYINTLWRESPDDLLLIELSARSGNDDTKKGLVKQLSQAVSPDRQVKLLSLLREFGQSDVIPVVLPMIQDKSPIAVFQEALGLLSRFDDSRIVQHLLQAYPLLAEDRRALARSVLFARPASALEFLQCVDRGELSPEIPLEQLRTLANHKSHQIDEIVRKHWGNLGPGTTEEKLATIRRFSNDLRAAPGQPANGKTLFLKHCGVCHQLRGEGDKIGPDLTTANRTDLAALLANIVDPNSVIRREYVSYVITTSSGQVATGIIVEQDGASMTIHTPDKIRIKLPRDQIEEIVESTTSHMPERILESLTPQELRDLFSYLQQ
jgi:putative heme-binding domain-containing protein